MSDLLIRIAAEFGGLKAAVTGVQAELAKVSQAARRTGADASQALNRARGSAASLALPRVGADGRLRTPDGRFSGGSGGGRGAGGIGAESAAAATQVQNLLRSLGGLAAFAGFAKLSDDAANLRARLALVTRGQEEFNTAFVRLFEIAQSRGQSFTQTAELFTKLAQATKDVGTSQEALLQVTSAVNDAVALSGSTAESANAALIQLGQGLASGTLRGEELNSVLEQTPVLADAIAKGMGITRGELRAYGEQGKITSDAVIRALLSQREVLARQAETLPATFGRAFNQIRNSSLLLLDTFQSAFGKENGLARILSDFGTFLSSDQVVGGVAELAEKVKIAIGSLITDFGRLTAMLKPGGDTTSALAQFVEFVRNAFVNLPENIRAFVRIVTVEVATAIEIVRARAEAVRATIRSMFSGGGAAEAERRFAAQREAILTARREQIADILSERDANLGAADAAGKKATADREAARAARGAIAVGGGAKLKPPDAKDLADRAAKLAKDEAERAIAQIETFYDAALITAQEFISRRSTLQLAAIDKQIEAQQRLQAAAKDGGDALKAKTEIELLERQKTDVLSRAEAERTKIREEAANRTRDLQIRDAELSGRQLDADRLRIRAQFNQVIRELERAGDEAGATLARKLVDRELLQAQFQDLERQATKAINDMQARLAQIGTQRDLGTLAAPAADAAAREARATAINQLGEINTKMQDLARTTNDPTIVEGARRVTQALQEMARDGATGVEAAIISLRGALSQMRQDFVRLVADAGVDALTGLFVDLADKSKTTKEALEDFALSFARSMAQIAARALATFAVIQLLDSIYPGLGRVAAAGMGASAPTRHHGGMVGSPAPMRRVSPLVFAGAPYFHGGGMVGGLRPNEVPAILEQGEEVLSKNDPRNQANGGGGGSTRIVNVIDPNLFGDWASSSSGERTFINTIERNRGAVRQILGVA